MASQFYQALETQSRQIRILRLLQGSEPSPIECRLEVVSLDEIPKPQYQAVSYAWGSSQDTKSFRVEDVEIEIRSNLEACLRHLREPDIDLRLWVDAVCINQADDREKSQQVAMMGEIFRSCTSSYIWLGVPNPIIGPGDLMAEHNDNANVNGDNMNDDIDPFDLVRHFANDGHLHGLPCFEWIPNPNSFVFRHDPAFERLWRSFTNAITKPWWTRFWCVQESLLSPSATVVLGRWRLPWTTVKECEIKYKSHVATCCASCAGSMPPEYIFYPDLTVVSTFVDADGNIALDPSLSNDLDRLLRSFRYKTCQDPRDKVYGILGLIETAVYSDLTVDYTLEVRKVYLSVMEAMLKHTSRRGDLRCLTGLGFNSASYDLPSWVRNFEVGPDIGSLVYEMWRYSLYDLYRAAGDSIANAIISDDRFLSVRGYFVDKIERVGDVVTNQDWSHIYGVVQNWLDIAGIDLANGISAEAPLEPTQEAFWRTLLGNIVSDDGERAQIIGEAESQNFEVWVRSIQNAVRTRTLPPTDRFLKSLVVATFSRAMFCTKRGYFGLCYSNCQPNDEIWVLEGGRVPFLLRPCEQGNQSENENSNRYTFLGEGYLHGFMDGEAVQDRNAHVKQVVLQ